MPPSDEATPPPAAPSLAGVAGSPLLEELSWRGALFQHTPGLAEFLGGPGRTGYCGFDATGPSLHVGHLVPVMGLMHLQRHGHRPLVLVGGGTGMIGDPSGRSSERVLNTPEVVESNAAALRIQLERFLDFGRGGAIMRNNADWLGPLRAIDLLRDVGKHFTVNYMLAKESVRSRMDDGISFTEFSYMLLQAYDFLELYRREGVTLQIGGSDQWGNMTAGMELIRRSGGGEAHVLTLPLITKADGSKFGKTESGSVWLDPELTTPYQFYQFWINSDDRDVGRFLRLYSLRAREELEALEAETQRQPERRTAQQALAAEVTERVHGPEQARAAAEVSALLFTGSADPRALSPGALALLRREVSFTSVAAEESLPEAVVADALTLLVETGLAGSRGAAKRLAEQGGLYVNGERRTLATRMIAEAELLPGRHVLLRKGARDHALAHIQAR